MKVFVHLKDYKNLKDLIQEHSWVRGDAWQHLTKTKSW